MPGDRFWSKVAAGPNGCIVWTAYVDRKGYGKFGHRGVAMYAHRFAYEQMVGPIPTGLQIDHLCRNRACVNHLHLEAVTQQENLRRGLGASALNAKKERCPSGHDYVQRARSRGCNECRRERYAERKGVRHLT